MFIQKISIIFDPIKSWSTAYKILKKYTAARSWLVKLFLDSTYGSEFAETIIKYHYKCNAFDFDDCVRAAIIEWRENGVLSSTFLNLAELTGRIDYAEE